MTRNELSEALRPLGMWQRVEGSEIRVTFTVDAIIARGLCASFNKARQIAEAMAYYTDDRDDALGTAKDMYSRFCAIDAKAS